MTSEGNQFTNLKTNGKIIITTFNQCARFRMEGRGRKRERIREIHEPFPHLHVYWMNVVTDVAAKIYALPPDQFPLILMNPATTAENAHKKHIQSLVPDVKLVLEFDGRDAGVDRCPAI